MRQATADILKKLDEAAEKRRREILSAPDTLEVRGQRYYVSAEGDDGSDGRSPETAWRTLARAGGAGGAGRRAVRRLGRGAGADVLQPHPQKVAAHGQSGDLLRGADPAGVFHTGGIMFGKKKGTLRPLRRNVPFNRLWREMDVKNAAHRANSRQTAPLKREPL